MRDATNTEGGLALWHAVTLIAPMHTRERSPIDAHGHGVTHCQVCKLSAALCDVPNTLEHHRGLGYACFACRDTFDAGEKILAMLAQAPSRQLNQTHMARKLGRKPASLNRALVQLRRHGLIERAYRAGLEKPSATSYVLTMAGAIGMGVA